MIPIGDLILYAVIVIAMIAAFGYAWFKLLCKPLICKSCKHETEDCHDIDNVSIDKARLVGCGSFESKG